MPHGGRADRYISDTPDSQRVSSAPPRWPFVLAIAVVIIVGAVGIGFIVHRTSQPGTGGITSVRLDGAAMEPTLRKGDTARFKRRSPYSRGDIVWLNDPGGGSTQRHVRRIVAIGGDIVALRGGVLYLNGVAVPEAYVITAPTLPDISPVTVPSGQVYVLGDNRPDSRDSREWGPIPLALVRGGLVT